jgi:hypothetical protein
LSGCPRRNLLQAADTRYPHPNPDPASGGLIYIRSFSVTKCLVSGVILIEVKGARRLPLQAVSRKGMPHEGASGGLCMLSYQDCVGLCDLTEDEIRAIAEHERLPELVALELGQYLVQSTDGQRQIRRMILDDLKAAQAAGHAEDVLRLKATMKHFIDTHPDNPQMIAAPQ